MATIGTDPEVFLLDDTGEAVPSCGLVGGTKTNPKSLGGDGFFVQEDNVMLEFNVPPSSTEEAFVTSIREGLTRCHDLVRTRGDGYSLYLGAEQWFSEDKLRSPQAMLFGCSPEFAAYSGGGMAPKVLPRDLEGEGGAYRFAGGHVHLGYDVSWEIPDHVAAKFADLFIGLRCVRFDKQGKRRELYGKAGRYRPTPYGIEYRTLSNSWLKTDDTARVVAAGAFALCKFLENADEDTVKRIYREIDWEHIERTINNEDEASAGLIYHALPERISSAVWGVFS